ncbi:LysR family transcriptional regulator [Burkholderia vietnamiensis]|uniref:LysR family transcriptional regulator n=1 Tax=Burkholderia vietnamiensis TaxID=60552 RepID=UPI0015933990|nr:LysR family transcriptional regulator [Burkholderia vietnamiensis]
MPLISARNLSVNRDLASSLPWDLIRAFLALSRHGSYEVAAQMEGIDDSTLRRRIRQLEQQLGRTLFVRSDTGWQASADLHALVDAAQRMEEAARCFSRDPQAGAGVIRVSMMDVFAQRFGPVFLALREKYPQLVFAITTESHFVNLEQDQVDIAVRLARPERNSNSLRVRKLGMVPVGAYASRAYLEHDGARARIAGFTGHSLLEMSLQFFHHDHDFIYAHLDWSKFGLSGKVLIRTDCFSPLARMCALGHGVALLPSFVAAEHPALETYPGDTFVNTELWLVSRFDMHAAWQRDLAEMLQAELGRVNAI